MTDDLRIDFSAAFIDLSRLDFSDPFVVFIGLHELAHLKIANWLRIECKTLTFDVNNPRPTNNGNLSLGHITVEKATFVDGLLMSLGGYFLWIYWLCRHEKLLLKFSLHPFLLLQEIKQVFSRTQVSDAR
jgi:hypothetical protein